MSFTSRLGPFMLIGLLGCSALLSGCGSDARAPQAVETPPASAPVEPNYSPFVVDLQGTSPAALPFHLISFKDVGMSLPDDASRQLAYESLAEALSLELLELSSELGADMISSVRHDHRVTDPSAHLACEGGHLYVDVWRSGQDGPYGYSLWSGCGEDDRFAYNEQVPLVPQALPGSPSQPVAPSMDPLAQEIAESLEGALRRRCFQRAC
ncbi:MAG: hypothetical protein H6726_19635 [Sandaracinaceae bacterium]|nr:hypothetical protein [Sandaracinaceae bacterium]